MQAELRENIKNFLLNHDLCSMCVLRYLGERQQTAYCKLFEGWQHPKEPQRKRIQRTVCPSCLGILDPSYLSETFDAVADGVAASNCIFDDFLLSIAVPPVTMIRQRLVYLQLKKQFDYNLSEDVLATVKDTVKFVLGKLFEDEFKVVFNPVASFQVSVAIKGDLLDEEKQSVLKLLKHESQRQKKAMRRDEFSTKTLQTFLQTVSDDQFYSEFKFPPDSVQGPEPVTTTCSHLQIYFGGRYCKFSRELSQTPWVIDGERKMKDSVEELISNVVKKYVLCDKITFSSSGREDVDVRMLGNGRPFVLEIWAPRRIHWSAKESADIEKAINAATEEISVNRFQLINRELLKDLKAGEENKRKFYCAYCVTPTDTSTIDFSQLTSISDLVLKQSTPMRVLHRRTAMVRPRTIHSVSVEIQDAHHFIMQLSTQAGTYVKEFVHGDLGRTLPNVRTLLNDHVDIQALDVTEVDLDWPAPRQTTQQNTTTSLVEEKNQNFTNGNVVIDKSLVA